MRKQLYWFSFVLLIILIDQLTKYWAYRHLLPYEPNTLLSFFNLTLAYNTGGAFSFLSNTGSWHFLFFIVLGLIISGVLSYWIIKSINDPTGYSKTQTCSFSLILGGALGNLLDRFQYGHVIDFLDLHYHHYHWPIFNIADSAISLGAALILYYLSFNRQQV